MATHRLEARYRARSLWLDSLPGSLEPRPELPGDVSYDVAIVGAGFTGLWTAYYLKRLQRDLRVVVLEREIAGFGPSGRNGGWVSAGIAGSWPVYSKRRGDDAVRRAERETYAAVDEIARVTESEGIPCGLLKAGTLTIAMTGPQKARLEEEMKAARRHGSTEEDRRLIEGADLEKLVQLPECRLASYSPHCARVNPALLVRGLADACQRAGVVLYERTEALEIGPKRVRCRQGVVSADHILRATESYTTQFPGQSRRYLPLYSLMIATEPLGEATWKEIGWQEGLTIRDRRHLFFYAQRTLDGRIAIGGRGAPYTLSAPISESGERNAGVRERLETTLRRHFPAAADAAITHHWGGPLAVPRDWCMAINYDRTTGLGWAGGYSGHGVVATNISGRTLADLVLGRESDLVSLPWVGHRVRGWEPEPLRFMACRAIVEVLGAADRYEDETDRRARRAALVSPFMQPS